jgi:hypothetical protein
MDTTARLFKTRGAYILEYRKGGGRLVLFGLPFFLVGLFVTQIPFGIIPVEVDGGPIVLAILLPMGPLFAAVGFILMLSRSGITIDRSSRIVIQWWGLLIPIRRKGYNLDHFVKVRIDFRAGERNESDTFPISLVGTDSENTLYIVELAGYEITVKAAEELARFIGKPLEDLAIDFQNTESSP